MKKNMLPSLSHFFYVSIFLLVFILMSVFPLSSIVFAQQTGGGIKTGSVMTFYLYKDKNISKGTNIPQSWDSSIDDSCLIGIYFPKGFVKGNKVNVLTVFGPGSNNINAIGQYTGFAEQLGMIIISPEPQRSDTSYRSCYYYTLKTVDYLKQQGLITPSSKVVIGGMSGGGKLALIVGTFGGDSFTGTLAIGCNQDTATVAYSWLPNSSAKRTPIVILNSPNDSMVSPFTESVLDSLKQTGFQKVYHHSYTGGHEIPYNETLSAIKFLLNK